jgi:hypothetical protein
VVVVVVMVTLVLGQPTAQMAVRVVAVEDVVQGQVELVLLDKETLAETHQQATREEQAVVEVEVVRVPLAQPQRQAVVEMVE